MHVSPDDRFATSVLAAGLLLGLFHREDVVRWADRRIESSDIPPGWLIDLSLSQNLHDLDLIALLRRVGAGADPVATCRALYAFCPGARGLSFDAAAKLAERLYHITYDCLDGDWTRPLLAEADQVADTFDFVREGYVDLSRDDAVRQLDEFIERHRDEDLVKRLAPVAWSVPR
jgi:hypothetical protein